MVNCTHLPPTTRPPRHTETPTIYILHKTMAESILKYRLRCQKLSDFHYSISSNWGTIFSKHHSLISVRNYINRIVLAYVVRSWHLTSPNKWIYVAIQGLVSFLVLKYGVYHSISYIVKVLGMCSPSRRIKAVCRASLHVKAQQYEHYPITLQGDKINASILASNCDTETLFNFEDKS